MSKIDEVLEGIENITFKDEYNIPMVNASLMKRLLDVKLRPYVELAENVLADAQLDPYEGSQPAIGGGLILHDTVLRRMDELHKQRTKLIDQILKKEQANEQD